MDKDEKKKKEKKEEDETASNAADVEGQEDHESEEVTRLQDQVMECDAQYKRALADYQNLEKRTREERSEWIKSANRDLLLRILPVLDTLALANQHVKDQGVQVTMQQFLDVLKTEGVVRIQTLGKKFDPHTMECIDKADDPSSGEAGSGQDGDDVTQEVRSGYMLYDKLLRPAHVRVGKSSK